MKKNKFLAGLISAVTLVASVGVVPVSANSSYSPCSYSISTGTFDCTLVDEDGDDIDDWVIIDGFDIRAGLSGTSGLTLKIPDNIEGIPVTNIASAAFSGKRGISKVVIPDSVVSIGRGAFDSCKDLVSITLPKNLEVIPDDCFCACSSLISIDIPSSVTSIGEDAFSGSGLASVTLPDSLLSLGEGVFANCSRLSSIDFGKGTYGLSYGAFMNCPNLAEVFIPDNVFSLGIIAFQSCTNLSRVTFGKNITNIPDCCFAECISLKTLVLPANILEVSSSAFSYSSSLSEVTIYNRACNLARPVFCKSSEVSTDMVIKGYCNSTAEEYALENDIPFVALDEKPVTTEPVVTTTTKATTTKITTTKTTTTYVETLPFEGEEIDWTKVLYGDLDMDGNASISDVVALSKFNASNLVYPLSCRTAIENADCLYDGSINSGDAAILIEYTIGLIDLDRMGNKDKTGLPMYNK